MSNEYNVNIKLNIKIDEPREQEIQQIINKDIEDNKLPLD